MPQPEHWRNGLITVPKRQDLIPLVDTVNYLSDLSMTGEPWYGSPLRALMRNTEFRDAAFAFDEAKMDAQAAAANLHSWQVELQFYGSEKTTLANWEYAQELVARAVPGARFTAGESLKVPLTPEQIDKTTGPYPTNMRRNITQGVPGLGVWYQTGRTDQNPNAWNETHIGLFSLVARSGEAVLKAQKDFADIARRLEVPTLFPNAIATPVQWYQFGFLMGNGFGLGGGDTSPAGKKKAAELLRRTLAENAKLGYGDYRAPPMLQDDVADQYSFNNYVLRRFMEQLKDAADPNGILSPGRAGVWPAAHRSLARSVAVMSGGDETGTARRDAHRARLRPCSAACSRARVRRVDAVHAQTTAVERGKAKFEHTCAPCHAPAPATTAERCCPARTRCGSSTRASCPR